MVYFRMVVVMLFIIVGVLGCATSPTPSAEVEVHENDAPTPTPLPTMTPGPAPDLTFTLLDGTETTLQQWEGKGIILNFWATWCIPCRTEMPLLADIHESGQDVVVIGVNYLENQESAEGFVRNFDIPFPIVVDPRGFLAGHFGVRGLPTTYYINAAGDVVNSKIGPITQEELDAIIPTLVE